MPPVVMTRSPTFRLSEERLHLLLLPLHRQQDDEIEDRQDQHERDELQPEAAAFAEARPGRTPDSDAEHHQ